MFPLADRAAASGAKLKEQAAWKYDASTRVNRKTALTKEAAYLKTRPSPQPPPASPPIDTPGELRGCAERALAFERLTVEVPIGARAECKEARLSAIYSDSKDGWVIAPVARKISTAFTERNNALPTWRDADGLARYEIPVALTDLTLAGALLILWLSVTATIQHPAHGGVASTGHVASPPKPIDPISAVRPRLPDETIIVSVRRGETEGLTRKKNMLYYERREKVLDAMRWMREHIPYYADVVVGPSRLATLVEGSEIPGVIEVGRRAVPSQRTKAHRPTRSPIRATYLRRRTNQGDSPPRSSD